MKKKVVRQVGYLQRLYREAVRSAERDITLYRLRRFIVNIQIIRQPF
jgi:hypothetical protein